MTLQPQTHIPLRQAAIKYGVSTEALTRLAKDGIIRLVHTREGDSVVTISTVATAADAIIDEVSPAQFEHLRGHRISLTTAAEKYNVSALSLRGWVEREYIRVLQREPVLQVDEADVAYVARVYGLAEEVTGSPLKAGWALKRVISRVYQRSFKKQQARAVEVLPTVAAVADIVLDEIRPEKYEHLRGNRIRLMEASRQCSVSEQNLLNWSKQGYIEVLGQSFQRIELDAADAELVSDVFRRARELTVSPIKAGWVLKRVIAVLNERGA